MLKVIITILMSCTIGLLSGILAGEISGINIVGQVVTVGITYRALVVIANPVLERYKQEKLNNNK